MECLIACGSFHPEAAITDVANRHRDDDVALGTVDFPPEIGTARKAAAEVNVHESAALQQTRVDHPNSAVVDGRVVDQNRVDDVIKFGGDVALTTFVSGSFAIDELEATPILSVLPPFLHLRLAQDRTHAFQSALNLLAIELHQPGLASDATIARLYEILFVYAVRAYVNSGAVPRVGWLSAISDKQLAPAAMAMHERLAEDWTLESLAAKAYMSGSAFASKFKAVAGQTALEYLTHWRVHRAKLSIRNTRQSVGEVAHKVGYESETSFSRVFKRVTGMTPGAFRRSRLATQPGGRD
jgi:AraC-like DNA-binding protein